MKHCSRVAFVFVLLVLGAVALQAGSFTVTLKNGTAFETRYRPVDAEWDESVSMILTDRGNWIALAKDEIDDVTSAAEISGFGYQLDTSTIVLGWTYNENGEDAEGEGAGGGAGAQGSQAPQGNFSIDDFIDPADAAGALPFPTDYFATGGGTADSGGN